MVIVGAMQSLGRNDDDRLQLWPFPQEVPMGEDRAAFWRRYRERMISNAGACIVLAGDKVVAGTVVSADGVRQEVQIAREQGKAIIPVGATGHIARELWEECRAKPLDFLGDIDVAGQIDILGNEAAGTGPIVEAIIDILRELER